MHFGVILFPHHTSFLETKEAVQRIEALGYDSVWSWDHFVSLFGPVDGPNLEGWQLLPAWAMLTERIRLGVMVSCNTYRHPGLIAKMAATLDHVSSGRAMLGLGAGWHEAEHAMYGIHLGTPGERLDKLAEAATIVRSLLDEGRATFQGRHYNLQDAICLPRPVQPRLPLLIGGAGERKTLRIAAQHADMWNGYGTPERVARSLSVLKGHCEDVGTDFNRILTTVKLQIVVGAPSEVERRKAMATPTTLHWVEGNVEQVAEILSQYRAAGIKGVMLDMPPPYDYLTLERLMTEVKPLVLGKS